MKRIAIIGMGLMGGSLGLALKRRGLAEVCVYARREETRQQALAMGAADCIFEKPELAVQGADIAVFCLPITSIPEAASHCRKAFKPGCHVTDVGSTKFELVESMRRALAGSSAAFVGSHPMTGSERAGMEAARADLYQGAVTALTPVRDTPASTIEAVSEMWRGVGARVYPIDPSAHDLLVARTSHLVHLGASLLAATVGRDQLDQLRPFCGPGFRDTTRVASGAPEIWHDIIMTNRPAILAELQAFQAQLARLTEMVESGDFGGVRGLLAEAKNRRDTLLS